MKAEQVATQPLANIRSLSAWKKASRCAWVGFACLSLYACAITPAQGPGMSSDVLDGVHKEGVRPPFGTTSHFRKQTKGKVATVSATMTALSIANAVLGGGVAMGVRPVAGTRNHKPADGYTVTDGHATVFTNSELSSYADAETAMNEALHRKLIHSGIAVSSKSPYALKTIQNFWGIDYETMGEKDNYRLYYNIETSLMQGKKTIQTYTCAGATDHMGSYAYWTENDKKNVKLHAAVIGDICAGKALAALGLKAESRS